MTFITKFKSYLKTTKNEKQMIYLKFNVDGKDVILNLPVNYVKAVIDKNSK